MSDLVLFFSCIFISAFFSSAETAFTAMNRLKLRTLEDLHHKGVQHLQKLLLKPKELLTAIRIGSYLSNVAATVIATLLLVGVFTDMGGTGIAIPLIVITLVVSAVIMILGDITPKSITLKFPERFALWMARPISIVIVLFTPLMFVFTWIYQLVSRVLGIRFTEFGKVITTDEIKSVMIMAQEEGLLDKEERDMIHSIIEFGDTIVREIMTPRTDAICIDGNSMVAEAIEIIRENGHSRLPVYQEDIDNITGVLYAKDLLSVADPAETEVHRFMRPAIFIPETRQIEAVLKYMKRAKFHLAIVVDEHGGMSGIVTMEDILEEIVGEIQDEYDHDDPSPFTKVGEHHYIVDARLNIDDLAELLETTFPNDDDYDTLGGFVLSQMDEFPRKGDEIRFKSLTIRVREVNKRRIMQLEILQNSDHAVDSH